MENSTIGQVFITATKEKYRFLFNGFCTIEHLWDMSINDLDFIYKELEEGLNAVQVPGLLKNQPEKKIQEIKNKLSIIEFIFNSKVEQEKAAEKAALKAQQNQRILAIIAQKKDVELENMPVEELEKLIA